MPFVLNDVLGPWLEPRPSTGPDGIATYLFLDEPLLGRLQHKPPTGWALSDAQGRVRLVLKFVGEITTSSAPDSTKRLLVCRRRSVRLRRGLLVLGEHGPVH
jgi:hypothetical protein